MINYLNLRQYVYLSYIFYSYSNKSNFSDHGSKKVLYNLWRRLNAESL